MADLKEATEAKAEKEVKGTDTSQGTGTGPSPTHVHGSSGTIVIPPLDIRKAVAIQTKSLQSIGSGSSSNDSSSIGSGDQKQNNGVETKSIGSGHQTQNSGGETKSAHGSGSMGLRKSVVIVVDESEGQKEEEAGDTEKEKGIEHKHTHKVSTHHHHHSDHPPHAHHHHDHEHEKQQQQQKKSSSDTVDTDAVKVDVDSNSNLPPAIQAPVATDLTKEKDDSRILSKHAQSDSRKWRVGVKLFQKIDKNKSGQISIKQFRHLLRKVRGRYMPSAEELQQILEQVDVSHSGFVDQQAFCVWWCEVGADQYKARRLRHRNDSTLWVWICLFTTLLVIIAVIVIILNKKKS